QDGGFPTIATTATVPCAAPGHARRGASGSLNPQSAPAGPNTVRGAGSSGPGPDSAALTARVRALGAFEPRQVRKEAALRSSSQVRGSAWPEQADQVPPGEVVSTPVAWPGTTCTLATWASSTSTPSTATSSPSAICRARGPFSGRLP